MKCKECGGTGWITKLVPSSEAYAYDDEHKEIHRGVYEDLPAHMVEYAAKCPVCNGGEAVIKRKKKRANLPASFYDVKIEAFDWSIYEDDAGRRIDLTKQQQFVTSFLDNFKIWQDSGVGLYIWSKVKGNGKTFLASAICNTLIERYHVASKFVSVSELIFLEKNADKDKNAAQYATDPILELCECDVLVLDDLGQTSAGGAWLEDILFRIFDTRMQNKLITIVTSNKKIDAHQIDDRISDRMNDILQPLPLPDYKVRSAKAKDKKKALLMSLGLMGRPQPEPQQLTIEDMEDKAS